MLFSAIIGLKGVGYMRRLKVFSMVFLLLFSLTSQDVFVSAQSSNMTNIATDSVNVRSGPGLSYDVVDSLKRGEQVKIISTSDEWLQVKYKEQSGWIASWLTAFPHDGKNTPIEQTEIISKTDALNFRENPSVNAPILTRMNAGDKATLLNRQGDWLQIQFNGSKGWVYAQYTSEITIHNETESTEETNKLTQAYETFTVAVDALNVRQKADQSSKKVNIIHKGETYPIQQVNGNWLQIKMNNKKEGWVYSFHGELSQKKSTTKRNESSTAQKITILTNGTNIRSAASTSSEIVTRANAGDQFTIKAEHGDWYEVNLANDTTAFVANWVVSVDEAPTKKKKKKKQASRVPGTLKGLTIVVDPGHGGNDRGTTGARGTFEKTVTLKTAELLAAKLQAAGADVRLTRESDHYMSLQKRVWTSIELDADAFISIHYDANLDPSISGFTTYFQHQNQALFAEAVNSGLASTISLKNRGAQRADFYVLRENQENSILIELGFLSNPSEELMINGNNFREQASYGIYQGVLNYFNANSK